MPLPKYVSKVPLFETVMTPPTQPALPAMGAIPVGSVVRPIVLPEKLSVKVGLVMAVAILLLVMVKVSVEVPPATMDAGPNVLVIDASVALSTKMLRPPTPVSAL